MADPSSERRRIEETYAAYGDEGHQQRWDGSQPGNRAILAERAEVLDRLVAASGADPTGGRLLDVGCGSGDVAVATAARLGVATVVGVDLLADRVAEATRHHGARFAVADATALPLPSGSIRAVQCFTVLSSVLDGGIRAAIAAEIERVLEPGGVLLWYDMRYPSPQNRSVRPLGADTVAALFPGLRGELVPVTFLPPLARILGDRRMAKVLARPSFMRSHLAGALRKPGGSTPRG